MAVTTVTACPECDKKFKVRAELEGKKIRCPACGEAFVVAKLAVDRGGTQKPAASAKKNPPAPPPKTAPAPAPPPGQPAKSGTVSWSDEEDDNPNPYGVTTLDLTPRCPHCANELPSEDTLICLYCGYNTQTRELGSTRKVLAIRFEEHFVHLLPGLLCVLGILLLIVLHLYFVFEVPSLVAGAWTDFLDHESMRLWFGSIFLGLMWGLGIFAYKRLMLDPKPKEKLKD